ncbi:glycerate kinase [Nakamurella lactea]|uniref:glycerate kinase n=1 Tax=Nakamurella lactea TaxID=459515 RepID=UPI000423145B|nr:glycerate kinase [Nakamurella lactea]
MRVLIAPDSFKGSATARQVAEAIADGWRSVRPQDEVRTLPLADGGEGSADAIVAASPGARQIDCAATGPDGHSVAASWWLLTDGTAAVELAAASGLPQMATKDALRAQTTGFGELLLAAVRHPQVRRIVATLGGSAATDGGTGALRVLGARFLDTAGDELNPGGAALERLATVDVSDLTPPPPGGVQMLTDVTAPLLGPRGAAAVFGPQKGATDADVVTLDGGLRRLHEVIGGNPDRPGSGAAGGTGFGLATLWSAATVPGADRIGQIVGLPAALADADLVITGEGRFDDQSTTGKVVGHLLQLIAGQRVSLVAGQIAGDVGRFDHSIELTGLAGSSAAAMQDTQKWLVAAGSELAAGVVD